MNPGPSILGLGTAAPDDSVTRDDSLALASDHSRSLDPERLEQLYRESGVSERGCTLGGPGMRTELLAGLPLGTTTSQRLALFMPRAAALAERAARSAFADAAREPASVTHLVTVSCTGAESPGIDHQLVDRLGLSPDVSRTHVGFMGCHAAVNALAVANAFVRANPDAVVLVACVELCSLHFQAGETSWDQQVANAIFADGAACAVVGGGPGRCRIGALASRIFPGTAALMRWDIGDNGFRMTLSPRVPGVIKRGITDWLGPWLDAEGLSIDEVSGWAVHPGGRDILEGVRRGLQLDPALMAPSIEVLDRRGNMSSGTILWVLDRVLREPAGGPVLGLSFGPGLTGEAILLRR